MCFGVGFPLLVRRLDLGRGSLPGAWIGPGAALTVLQRSIYTKLLLQIGLKYLLRGSRQAN